MRQGHSWRYIRYINLEYADYMTSGSKKKNNVMQKSVSKRKYYLKLDYVSINWCLFCLKKKDIYLSIVKINITHYLVFLFYYYFLL